MMKATLCALAGFILATLPGAEASSLYPPVDLGYTPAMTTPPALARRWDGTLDNAAQAGLRAVVTELGWTKIRGADERSRLKHKRWQHGLEGDRLEVYASAGQPTYRYFELVGNTVRELWTYPEQHTQFIFVGDALVERRLQ